MIFKVLHSFLSAGISFAVIDGLGLVAVFVNAWFFLSRISQQTMSRIAGLVWLAITTPLLFRYHYYHPSDFVGVSIMFHMILAVYQKRQWRLSVLCLISGIFWEKAILVPGIYFLWILRNDSFKNATCSTLPSALSVLIVFIAFRLFRLSFPEAEPNALPTYQAYFLRIGLKKAILEWLVWVLPVCVLLVDTVVNKRKVGFFWLIWLIYVPFLIGVLLYFGGNLYELRSFWILQPIFIGYIVSWFNSVYYSGDRDSDFSEVSI
jgi:hypothetical protein